MKSLILTMDGQCGWQKWMWKILPKSMHREGEKVKSWEKECQEASQERVWAVLELCQREGEGRRDGKIDVRRCSSGRGNKCREKIVGFEAYS